jgi:hypothetical protein
MLVVLSNSTSIFWAQRWSDGSHDRYGANQLNTTKVKQSLMPSLMSQIDHRKKVFVENLIWLSGSLRMEQTELFRYLHIYFALLITATHRYLNPGARFQGSQQDDVGTVLYSFRLFVC